LWSFYLVLMVSCIKFKSPLSKVRVWDWRVSKKAVEYKTRANLFFFFVLGISYFCVQATQGCKGNAILNRSHSSYSKRLWQIWLNSWCEFFVKFVKVSNKRS
jgi:hypothetical protein